MHRILIVPLLVAGLAACGGPNNENATDNNTTGNNTTGNNTTGNNTTGNNTSSNSTSNNSTSNNGTSNNGTSNNTANNTSNNTTTTNNNTVPTGPTYYGDVAPIMRENCWSCHFEGGVGPFQLDEYETAKTWGTVIKEVTQSRQMPPKQIVADGSCNDFEDADWLSDDDLATIADWVDTGMAEGDPADMPDPLEPEPGLPVDSLTIQIPEVYQPVAVGDPGFEFDDYRCFMVDPGLDTDQFITAHNVLPDNDAVVHHVLVFTVNPSQVIGDNGGTPVTNADVMAGLDAASPDQLGWPCAPLAGDNVVISGLPVTWAPGQGVVRFPQDTGAFLSKDDVFVVQVHYNLVNDQGPDQTEIQFEVADSVARTGFFDLQDEYLATAFGTPQAIPPGESAHEVTWSRDVDSLLDEYSGFVGAELPYVDVYGILPHMHGLGVEFRAEVTGGPSDICLGQVNLWDFNWQYFYWYQQPIRLERGMNQTLNVSCTYDSSNEADAVYPGFGTNSEMCLWGGYVVLP